MIQTYSSTIRRKEMESVLTCMVDEKIGPGEMNARLIQIVKETTKCDGAIALRSSALALEYALNALALPKDSLIMLSALAPSWQIITVERLGYSALVLDVEEETGLVPVANVEEGIKEGGRLLVLHESMGILPDIKAYLALEVPIIEDISQSALAYYPEEEKNEEASVSENKNSDAEGEKKEPRGKRAGMYGLYAIFGMEDRDVVTSGGGAVLFAPNRKEWIPLKALADNAPSTDIMPDMNAALAFVEIKEYARNEETRRELFALYSRSTMSGRHKTFVRANDEGSTVYSFPLVLNSGFKDVKSYAQKKGIEVRQAFENSIIALRQEQLAEKCICANSLLLRCALFPLYPRLGQKDASRIVKVLSSLP
ncbi:MAG TPA: DegT/DnrJ/EryC1/StrS aminotransferase family protein [Treponema sp.]|nr:DegT/DnrJ/EryC1/StrS aminotransferase family protein [Treponema sp.]